MFGYLDIDKKSLGDGQRGLWQTFMCGLCMSTKNLYGNAPRMFISNDINFFNVLFHSITQVDVSLEEKTCFSHPFKKRTILHTDDLTDELSTANILLTYWNLYDDGVDGDSLAKKTALRSLKKRYEEAKSKLPQTDETIAQMYSDLQALEKSSCASVDKVSHPFALMSQCFAEQVLKDASNEYASTLCYNVGKWIYLIDALDDIKKDIKSGSYNVFVQCYGLKHEKDVTAHLEEIQFTMYSVLNRIAQSYNDLNLTKYTCILQNILFESVRNKTAQVLGKYKAC